MKALTGIALALSVAVTLAAAPKTPDYSGKWTLDRAASKNLPPMFEKVSSHKIDVSQTAAKFTVALDIARGEAAPIQQTLDFDLTGKPTQTETTVHTPGGDRKLPMTLKASVREDGRVEVTEEREMRGPEGPVTAMTYELWDVSADGKTLTIHRKDTMPRGTFEYDMVFTRG
jgi:hypothetical protein